MNEPTPKPGQSKEPEIAAAEWLFEDHPSSSAPSRPAPIVPDSGEGEGFALADAPVERETGPSGAAPGAGVDPPRPTRTGMVAPTSAAVEQVWSRSAEWGPTLFWLGGWGALGALPRGRVLWCRDVGRRCCSFSWVELAPSC